MNKESSQSKQFETSENTSTQNNPEQESKSDYGLIWQDHERRITYLEFVTASMQGEFKDVKDKVAQVEKTVKEGNNEQKEMLNMINNRMVDEFFTKKQKHFDNAWKVVFTLVSGGSILYVLIDNISKIFGS